MSNSLGYPNKKCTFAYRVVRRSKSQNISALALSLNRYHKSVTPSFQSDTQSDISFLIIQCKDTSFCFFIVAKKNKKHVKNCSLPVLCVKKDFPILHILWCVCAESGVCVFLAFAFSFGQMTGYSFYQLRFMVITTFPSQSFALRTESCISSVVH